MSPAVDRSTVLEKFVDHDKESIKLAEDQEIDINTKLKMLEDDQLTVKTIISNCVRISAIDPTLE